MSSWLGQVILSSTSLANSPLISDNFKWQMRQLILFISKLRNFFSEAKSFPNLWSKDVPFVSRVLSPTDCRFACFPVPHRHHAGHSLSWVPVGLCQDRIPNWWHLIEYLFPGVVCPGIYRGTVIFYDQDISSNSPPFWGAVLCSWLIEPVNNQIIQIF